MLIKKLKFLFYIQHQIDSQLYQRNAAKFFGDFDCGKSVTSQGSIFQKNAANFYGMDAPGPGERPFKIQKPSLEQVKSSKGFSILNEQRVKVHELNMQRDPKFVTNKDKFFGTQQNLPIMKGAKSTTSKANSKISDAMKLDTFIQQKY